MATPGLQRFQQRGLTWPEGDAYSLHNLSISLRGLRLKKFLAPSDTVCSGKNFCRYYMSHGGHHET